MQSGKGEREIVVIVGISGMGKTTLLRQYLRRSSRALVFDPLRVMWPGIELNTFDQIEAFLDSDRDRFRILFRPNIVESDRRALQAEMDRLAGAALEVSNCDVLVDEIDSFGEWDKEDLPPELYAVINFGRRKCVSLLGTVRRPQVKIPREWITECTTWDVFQVTDTYDLSILERQAHIKREDVAGLGRFEYLEVRPGEVKKMLLTKDFG